MWQEDINRNRAIGQFGADLLQDRDVVLTHCNAGSLTTVTIWNRTRANSVGH